MQEEWDYDRHASYESDWYVEERNYDRYAQKRWGKKNIKSEKKSSSNIDREISEISTGIASLSIESSFSRTRNAVSKKEAEQHDLGGKKRMEKGNNKQGYVKNSPQKKEEYYSYSSENFNLEALKKEHGLPNRF